MRVAFDLDGLLIPTPGSQVPVEAQRMIARLISRERMRLGTLELLQGLREDGDEDGYTTSLRSPRKLHLWFAAMGVRLDGVVNQVRHDASVCGTYQRWLATARRSWNCSGELAGMIVRENQTNTFAIVGRKWATDRRQDATTGAAYGRRARSGEVSLE